MKKIYLAGSCSSEQRTMMQRIAEEIINKGYTVYCPFEIKIPYAWNMGQEKWSHKVFEEDLKALNECDVFLMISPGRNSTAGTNWEQGYAYAKGKMIIVLQYTSDNTSLMTFCGSNMFVNTDLEHIFDKVIDVIDHANYRSSIVKEHKPDWRATVLT